MNKTLLKSVREFKKETVLTPIFVILEVLMEVLIPFVTAAIIDQGTLLGMPAVNVSFILPLICFVVIIIYGYRSHTIHHKDRRIAAKARA